MPNNTNTSRNKKYDIHDRIYSFVVNIIRLVNRLPKTNSNLVIINQILRSATSMGANDQEADGTLTKKDFLHCLVIVRKENKETNFWLKLISDTNRGELREEALTIYAEGLELVAIISKIINNTRK